MTPELLQRFCSTANEADYRPYLMAPWRRGGFIYATNGHLMVEIPDDGRECVEADKHPFAEKMFDKHPAGKFVKFPKLGPIKPEHKCERCDGAGWHTDYECDECEGVGHFEFGSHTYDCTHCDSTGRLGTVGVRETCLECDGFGESGGIRAESEEVGEARFQARYLRLIAKLPGAKLSPMKEAGAQFKFDGGRGIVMPYRV